MSINRIDVTEDYDIGIFSDGELLWWTAYDADVPGNLAAAVQVCRDRIFQISGDDNPEISADLQEALAKEADRAGCFLKGPIP